MKFTVSRTSTWDEQPCEEAVKDKCLSVDARTTKSPEEYDSRFPDEGGWLNKGKNHRIEPYGIARDFDSEAWFVELDGIDGMLRFSEKYGRLILTNAHYVAKGFPHIEIYDDYRE
jgi:hypothetical protein